MIHGQCNWIYYFVSCTFNYKLWFNHVHLSSKQPTPIWSGNTFSAPISKKHPCWNVLALKESSQPTYPRICPKKKPIKEKEKIWTWKQNKVSMLVHPKKSLNAGNKWRNETIWPQPNINYKFTWLLWKTCQLNAWEIKHSWIWTDNRGLK